MTPPDTLGSTVGDVAAALGAAGFDEPRRRARRLVAAALGLSTAEVFADLDRMIPAADCERVAELLTRMLAHEPLSRIEGVREFWGLEFRLCADTLDPRPETETVVEAVLARLSDRGREYRILDLGTGSGCLLLALLAELPAASGIGVDCAPGAAMAARDNAEQLGLAARADFVVGDWAAAVSRRFDVVVANPPYIVSGDISALAPEVRDFDPHRALDGGADGLDAYRVIVAALPRLLAPAAFFAAEIGYGQDGAVARLITAQGLTIDEIVPDLAGIPRCVVARGAG
jgi:release factor glutamine methyltransferase